jgi:hypothetical protein
MGDMQTKRNQADYIADMEESRTINEAKTRRRRRRRTGNHAPRAAQATVRREATSERQARGQLMHNTERTCNQTGCADEDNRERDYDHVQPTTMQCARTRSWVTWKPSRVHCTRRNPEPYTRRRRDDDDDEQTTTHQGAQATVRREATSEDEAKHRFIDNRTRTCNPAVKKRPTQP